MKEFTRYRKQLDFIAQPDFLFAREIIRGIRGQGGHKIELERVSHNRIAP